MSGADPSRLIAALARDRIILDLKTDVVQIAPRARGGFASALEPPHVAI